MSKTPSVTAMECISRNSKNLINKPKKSSIYLKKIGKDTPKLILQDLVEEVKTLHQQLNSQKNKYNSLLKEYNDFRNELLMDRVIIMSS